MPAKSFSLSDTTLLYIEEKALLKYKNNQSRALENIIKEHGTIDTVVRRQRAVSALINAVEELDYLNVGQEAIFSWVRGALEKK